MSESRWKVIVGKRFVYSLQNLAGSKALLRKHLRLLYQPRILVLRTLDAPNLTRQPQHHVFSCRVRQLQSLECEELQNVHGFPGLCAWQLLAHRCCHCFPRAVNMPAAAVHHAGFLGGASTPMLEPEELQDKLVRKRHHCYSRAATTAFRLCCTHPAAAPANSQDPWEALPLRDDRIVRHPRSSAGAVGTQLASAGPKRLVGPARAYLQ
ncbi:hypothetical protein B0H10DRAFT_2218994 [Mycena sp. CBHHK59/15]|nr:hypothetical protein B0H10DRAFT_2218994 [Mycena sp. CBHHK59/15]